MEKLFCFLMAVSALTACSGIDKKLGIQEDNPIEESVEKQIREGTGIEIEFTPQDRC